MIQGGDPTGTGRGGQSIFGRPFQDEITKDLKHTGMVSISLCFCVSSVECVPSHIEDLPSQVLASFRWLTLDPTQTDHNSFLHSLQHRGSTANTRYLAVFLLEWRFVDKPRSRFFVFTPRSSLFRSWSNDWDWSRLTRTTDQNTTCASFVQSLIDPTFLDCSSASRYRCPEDKLPLIAYMPTIWL